MRSLNRPILKKRDFKPVLANNKKEIFPLKRAFLDESERPVTRLSNQISSFRLETHKSLLTCVLLTFMLYYRIHGFLLTEWSVRKAFQSYVFHLRQQHWKHSILLIFERKIYPFFPPCNYAPDHTPYVCSSDLDNVICKFQKNNESFSG